jgi:formylglycine-generating enzyme required for sulfatase activity
VAACVLLLWLGSQQVSLGRTWTSHDGRYTVQASFVKLEGDAVTLQTADNQFRTVRLDQLSDADQDLARQLARALAHSVQAEAVGIGLSPDDALNDAFAKAIIQAVGAEVSAKTVIESDELVQDRVLVFSDGFVRDYKDFGCRQEAGLFYRKILAYVQRRDLRSDAVDSGEDGNARRLYAEAYTKVRRHRIGMLLVQEVLDSFNANMLDAKLADLGKPEVLPNDLDRVRITCRLTVQVRPDWYDQVRQKLENVLAAIARSQGHVEVMHRRFPAGHDKQRETVLQLQQRFWGRGEATAANFGDVYTLMNAKTLERLPDVAAANAREQGSTLFFIYSPPGTEDAASTGIKSRWCWFEIDDQPRMPTQGIDVAVRYTDQAGNPVLAERFPLGPEVPGLSANDTNAKLRTTVVSPFFLYHWSDGYEIKDFPHAHRVTLERQITVPLTTLARVHTAKALAVGEEVERPADFPLAIDTTPRRASDLSQGPPRAVAPFDDKTAKQHQAAWAEYLRTPAEHTSAIGMQLALIPPGEFLMGSPEAEARRNDDEFQHRVRITKPFYLGTHEVTLGQFRRFVEAQSYKTEAEQDGQGSYGYNELSGTFEKDARYTYRNPGFRQTDEHPVVIVSWNDTQAFCEWLSRKEGQKYRLPTEAEWEYGCRAGTKTRYESGDDPETLALVGNVMDETGKSTFPDWKPLAISARDGYVFTAPVGQFQANAFGLYDMHGNATEWCQDWYDQRYYRQFSSTIAVAPQGPTSGAAHVVRGGSWRSGIMGVRSAARSHADRTYRVVDFGFRVLCEAPIRAADVPLETVP